MSAHSEMSPFGAFRPRGVLRRDCPLAPYNAWGVGGRAAWFFQPADLDDLRRFLAAAPLAARAILPLGFGSNLLVRDGGFDGIAVRLAPGLSLLRADEEGGVVAQAGVACARVSKLCATRGFEGAAFLAGIPGTIGGALAMNAGCFGGEIWPRVESIAHLTRAGEIRRSDGGEWSFSYRQVDLPPDFLFFVEASLRFAVGDDPAAQSRRARAETRELLKRRRETQPLGQKNAGSVFKNPAGDSAGRLIESCGLGGTREGGAEVSTKHANFIVNTGGARAADIENLMRRVARVVREKQGVDLAPEVRVVGEAAAE